ncbi:GNAT family N-acetyltransferase [Nocardioides convexus]|uniref:GNAT family N-acetyltransferase n=1 Tax=Nocardioides convexus TaxID=2712224 RepID=UPI0024186511|nr:GNAT family N-acetyltransferase [Nocardioides convexus]
MPTSTTSRSSSARPTRSASTTGREPEPTPSAGSPGPAAAYAEHGFGLWVVETHDGRFVGDCGLTVQHVDDEPHVEVGYHVHPDLRGRGLATEAAAAVRDAAAADGVEHLVAIIRPANLPSQRVAAKIGLSLEREAFVHGGDALVFGADLTAPR